jgi:hypothetical protein
LFKYISIKKIQDANPEAWDSKICWEYSAKSSTTTLCPHIESHHLNLYLELAKAEKWKVQLPGLVLQVKSQDQDTLLGSQGPRPDTFDKSTFHKYLTNFIVTGDQV